MKFVKQLILATLLVGVASSASAVSFKQAKAATAKFCANHKKALIAAGSVIGVMGAGAGLVFGFRAPLAKMILAAAK